MKKIILFCLSFFILTIFVSAQEAEGTEENNNDSADTDVPESLSDTGSVEISNILIENFEDAGAWQGEMPRDLGIIRVQAREGGPRDLTENNEKNKFCLGAKILFFKTGASWFSISPPKDIAVKGLSKSFSVWVAGRNFKHNLKALIRDYNGDLNMIEFGQLNFFGWQELYAQIPMSIEQENYKLYSVDRPRGIKFVSFFVNCAQDETVGSYYLYIDDLRAKTDVFWENPKNKDEYNPKDTW